MASKAALKAVKASIDAGDFEAAALKAAEVVREDKHNFHAFMFQGFALEKLSKFDEAEAALSSAHALKSEDTQACKGLITLYEKQGQLRLDRYHEVLLKLARIYASLDDRDQCQNIVDKYERFAKKYGSKAQYIRALELIAPSSPLYPTLEGRVYHPSLTYQRILEASEEQEREWIQSQIAERRTRLGSRIDQVTMEVRSEAISRFTINQKYQNLIDWTADDELRHELEEKLLQRAYDDLLVTSKDLKPPQRDRVLNTANGMVIIKHKFLLAWNIALDWVDADDLEQWDVNILREYMEFFPDEGLAKVIRGYLEKRTPEPALDLPQAGDVDTVTPLSEAERLILMTQGLEDCQESILANRIMAITYLQLEEYQNAVDLSQKAQALLCKAETDFALGLQNSIDANNVTLGNALITYQSPRHHPESKRIFEGILRRKPKLTAALLGIGLILEEDEDYGEAAKFLMQAAERDPGNVRIKLEHAWCIALGHDMQGGLVMLEEILDDLSATKDNTNPVMYSEVLYRIAYCKWHLQPSATARKDKNGPYRFLIESIKKNPSYAPSYTLLGVYFQDYGKSKQRARVALQKAFELSVSELVAAERLARTFASTGEWDLVELVAKRVVDSGKARPAPGSKKKASSWPYTALGVVQMNRQQYSQAIVSFQAALRISPQDYHSWVGLGESYHNSGRYIAASRAFTRAESTEHGLPVEEAWFAKYMLANVQREMADYDGAISAYAHVLDLRPGEYGVLVALLQTSIENGWAKYSQGLFGQAVSLAQQAIRTAYSIAQQRTDVFNVWKSIGDACAIIGSVQSLATPGGLDTIYLLLEQVTSSAEASLLEVDQLHITDLKNTDGHRNVSDLWRRASALCHKHAIHVCMHDVHAQAVAWYNLGWAENALYASVSPSTTRKGKKPVRYLKAAVRCFKRAIELEAGNAEFWNALGVVTMTLNSKIAQHAFVRSLYLNDQSARVWTNLGALYLINDDYELANESFTKAQSADPEYASAWIGQGLIATMYGKLRDARGLFVHAFEIADASPIIAKQSFVTTAFDHLLSHADHALDIGEILRPLFALRQLHTQQPAEAVTSHLLSLFAERAGEYQSAVTCLDQVCTMAEADFETSESTEHLVRYAQAKADLARAQLAQHDYGAAIESSETALDLSGDDLGPDYAAARAKWRLSVHMTAGLAYAGKGDNVSSLKMFQAALEESEHDPGIVCMLAQVLWATGREGEKEAAQNQLFACVEAHPEHVQAVSLLGVMGLLENNVEVLAAVEDDLQTLRASAKVDVGDKLQMSRVLAGIISSRAGGDQRTAEVAATSDAMTSIMLAPAQPQGWLELGQATQDRYVSQMALFNAKKQVPPHGHLEAEDLARAYAHSDSAEGVLVGHVLAPWLGRPSLAVQ